MGNKNIFKKNEFYFIDNNKENKTEEINFLDMEEIKANIYVGIGIKRMKGYKCELKIDELNQLRKSFWDIKTNYKNKNWKVWKIIKRAVRFDELRASILLEEYKIKTVNGCINHLTDSKGNIYKIPNYCINDPYFEKNIDNEQNMEEKNIKVKFYGFKNIEMEVNNKLKCKDLKKIIKNKIYNVNNKIIRLFFKGREILDDDFLYEHYINENYPIMIILNN